MARSIRICSLLVLALLVFSAGAYARGTGADAKSAPVLTRVKDKAQLVLGTSGSMPPMNMTTRDGRVVGLDVDLARYMADSMGVKLRIKTMPFSDLMDALESGKVDMVISNMTITPERNMRVAFAGPYLTSGKCLLSKEETLAAADEAEDINKPGTRLTALAGSTSAQFIRELVPSATMITARDYDLAVKHVLEGRAQALVADYPICVVSLKRYPDAGFVSVFSLLTYEPLGIALPANDPLLVNWTQNFLQRLEDTGHLEQLKTKWLEDETWLLDLPAPGS